MQLKTLNFNNDLIVQAPTGSGKTLAFLLPIVKYIFKYKSALTAVIIVPTRELALQIHEVALHFCKCQFLIGSDGKRAGVISKKKVKNNDFDDDFVLADDCNILVATPGKFSKLVERKQIHFKKIKFLILDEGDKLLSLGFENTLIKIINRLPKSRLTGIFTATFDDEIKKLSKLSLRNPVIIKEEEIMPSKLIIEYKEMKSFDKLANLIYMIKKYKCIVFFATCAQVDYFYELSNLLLNADDNKNEYNEIIEKNLNSTIKSVDNLIKKIFNIQNAW
ncbi:ATP-dependent rRNA helicase spb4 [Gurleya vavrai]